MKVWEEWKKTETSTERLVFFTSFGDADEIKLNLLNWENAVFRYGFRELLEPEGYLIYSGSSASYSLLEYMWQNFISEKKSNIDKMVSAFYMSYNPIENTDRFEDITDSTTNAGADTTTASTIKNTTDNRKTDMTDTPNISTSTTDSKSVYGYNDNNTASPSEKSEVVNNESGNRVTTTINSGGLDDSEETETINKKGTSVEFKHTNHTHGNIGVTTNAQMLEGEFEIRKKNLINAIFEEFFLSCSYVN